MNTRINSKYQPHPKPTKDQPVQSFHKGDTHLYKPFTSQKGLHCEGDQFGYVVEWEIHEIIHEE